MSVVSKNVLSVNLSCDISSVVLWRTEINLALYVQNFCKEKNFSFEVDPSNKIMNLEGGEDKI